MKTTLPEAIRTIDEAKSFITELYQNGESYHPEDDAHEIIWNLPDKQKPTPDQCVQLNKLFNDIYDLVDIQSPVGPHEFDPCGFLLDLFYEDHPEQCDLNNND